MFKGGVKKKKDSLVHTYKVPVVWQMWGEYVVSARSKKEAANMVLDSEMPLPDERHYLDDSLTADRGAIEEIEDNPDDYICEDELEREEDEDSVQIFWNDLTPDAQKRILDMLGENGNYDIVPIAEIMKGA